MRTITVNKKNIKVGACGICCETCGLYIKGICPGCPKTKEGVESLKKINESCLILKCAVNKNIEVCSRDCPEFPCSKFENWPLVKEWLEMFKERVKSKK